MSQSAPHNAETFYFWLPFLISFSAPHPELCKLIMAVDS